ENHPMGPVLFHKRVLLALLAFLPDCGVAPRMKHREHYDAFALDEIEHGIWKVAPLHATNLSVLHRESVRVGCGELDGAVDLRYEPQPQARVSLFVPERCSIEFGTCRLSEGDL